MGLVLVIIIILVIVLTLYGRIESQLPKSMRFSHASAESTTDKASAESATPVYTTVLPQAGRKRWLISIDGANSRAVREFSTPIRSPEETYDPPLLYFSCYQGRLYAWLDTRIVAAAAPGHLRDITVRINDGAPEFWVRQAGTTVSAPNPAALLALAEREPELNVTLAFLEAPKQSLLLDLQGSASLRRAMAGCTR